MTTKHPGLFVDLDKKTRDFLSKDFPDKVKFDFKAKKNGLNVELNIARSNDGSIYGSISPKYNFGAYGLSFGGQVDNKRAIKVDLTSDDALPGLKAGITGHGDSESVTVDGEYKSPYFTLAGSVNLFSAKGNKLVGSAVIGNEGLAVGVQSEYVYDKLQTVNGTLSYSNQKHNYVSALYARVNTQSSSNVLGFAYHQRFDRAAVAGDVSLDVNKVTDLPKITIGSSYDFPDKSEPITIKGKVDTEGRISVSYAQQLNKYARLIIGGTINTSNFSPSGNHSFGVTFSVND